MGNASSAAAKKSRTEATETSEIIPVVDDANGESVPEPGVDNTTKPEESPRAEKETANLSSSPENLAVLVQKDRDAPDPLAGARIIDSSISLEVAEQLTAVIPLDTDSTLTSTTETENENGNHEDPSAGPEKAYQPSDQSEYIFHVPANALILPTDPDLTHWVHIDDWEERKHWFHQGDLIEFYRGNGLYNHWGVYMGNGYVAHVTTFNLMTSSTSVLKAINIAGLFFPSVTKHPLAAAITTGTAMCIQLGEMMIAPSPPPDPANNDLYYYRMDPVAIIAGTDQFRVNNLANRAKDHMARTWEETFKLIHERINTVHEYSLLRNNCEHIATFFRYKPKDSGKKPRTK